ncbi:MAG: hypothetical protein M1824_005068 [Vezdaea acicularis]|nr:MAG: hypothetical protein M1824_005068 [Vezdaea acicularis]
MSDENSPPASPARTGGRRASFTTGTLSDLFGGRAPSNPTQPSGNSGGYSGSITAAANAQQRRRMSISTLGLSGSPTQASPWAAAAAASGARRGSMSSSGTGSTGIEESAIEDGDGVPPSTPSSPFARRMSFGARALRDVRGGRAASSSQGTSPQGARGLSTISSQSPSTSTPSSKMGSNVRFSSSGTGEGFNWSGSLSRRAEERASFSNPSAPTQQRAASTAAPVSAPVQETPKPVRAPDHFQERILKGDFYMD